MSGSEIIDIEGVGPVLFERSRQARQLNISVRPSRGIRVAVPIGLSFNKARKMVITRRSWMARHLERLKGERGKHEELLDSLPEVSPKAARKMLIEKLEELASKYGFSYNRVSIRNQRTRWGSCSAKNNISLNIKLARIPADLMDYVLLHELVHTRVKNHGKAFWKALDNIVGDAKEIDAKLKVYHLDLM